MNDIIETLLEHGIEHPARTLEFSELTKGLFVEVENGNINVNYHPEFPHIALFKYTQNCVTERNWNLFSLMARGLILDLKNKTVIATGFMKFFNLGEMESGSTSIIQSEFTTTTKYDGSMGILTFFEDKWRVATLGSFMSEQAQWAGEWVYKNMPIDKMDKTNTYLFEIIYPENKIVVDYDFEGLVLLGIIDSFGLEYDYEQLVLESSYLETRYVEQHDFNNMDSIIKNAKSLDKNNEGYVIRFKNGVRLKVKGDEYVRIHRLISRVTPLAIWESILSGDDLKEVKKELPEEMEADFDTISSLIYDRLKIFVEEVETIHNNTKSMTNKELGLYMRDHPEAFEGGKFEESKKYIFLMRNEKFYESLRDYDSLSRRKIFNIFRPKANILSGYTPSSVVNRFVVSGSEK